MKKRIVSLFMALVMTLTMLPAAAWATEPSENTDAAQQTWTEQTEALSAVEEPQAAGETAPVEVQPAVENTDAELTDDNSFLLFAATNVKVLIAPERVPYQSSQTVREALLALQDREESPHTFDGLETVSGFVTAIDGVTAGYSRSDDKGSFDLTQSASAVGAFMFLTAYDTLNEETASALYALGRAMLAWQEAEKPQMQKFAQQEYDDAAKALTVKKTADELTALVTALTERMEAYLRYEKADTIPLNVHFLGLDGQPLTEYTFTAEDPYGNEKTFTNEHPALAAGSYTFTLTSGLNGASGDMTVAEDGSVTVAGQALTTLSLPQGVEWIAQPVLRSVNGGDAAENRYPMAQDGTVALVPDTVGPTGGLYLYGEPGDDLTSRTYQWNGTSVALYAVYTDVNGKEIDKSRSWESTYQALANLLTVGTQGSGLRLEARAEINGYTLYQAWELTLERTPTLCGLSVMAGGVDQKLDFSGTTTEYDAIAVTTESVVLRPDWNGSYTVTVNGSALNADGTYTLSLTENSDTTAAITVTMPESGRTTTYTLTVTRKAAVPLTVAHEDGVTVQIFNAAGVEIGMNDDNTYPLIPGGSGYTYVATKNEYYHTRGAFDAPKEGDESLTITAVTPETDDYLTSLKLASGSTATSSVYLSPDQFSVDKHQYDAQLDDRYNSVYIWATAVPDKSCTIRVPLANGQDKTVPSGNTAGVYAPSLKSSAEPSRFTVLVSREDTARNVTFEQDYLVDFARVLTLEDMSLSVDGMETLYYQVIEGEVTDYDGFYWKQYAYQATVLGSAQQAVLTVEPSFTNYRVRVIGGRIYAPEVDPETGETAETITITLPLDETKQQETVILEAYTNGEQEAHTYTLTLKKGAPIDTTITIQDKDTKQTIDGALAAVYEMRSGSRVWPNDDGTFSLVEGLTYTCVATCSGYVGVTQEIAAGSLKEIVISLTEAPASSHGAGVTSSWPSFRGNDESNGVVSARIPTSSNTAVLSWANKLGDGYSSSALGCPILIEEGGVEFLIVYSGRTLYKVESVTGTVVATGAMCDTSSFAITSATYADCGMLFVALSSGTVQAFDAATLDSLWIYQDALGGQPNCPLTYHDGYVYTGFWNQEKENANFVCLSATDEDPTSSSEKKLARWTYTRQGGFYWAGAYVCDDYLLVGADDGQDQSSSSTGALLCLDPSTGAELARWDDLRGDVRSSIARGEDGLFYFTSKGGYLYSAAVTQTADGWAITNQRSCSLSNGSGSETTPAMSTCTPVLYNGRAYIGVSGTSQFGAYTGHNITVVDLDSMEVAYSVPTKGYPQTSGLLTTAYDVPCVYFFDNFTPGILRLLEDTGTGPRKTTTETYQESGSSREVETAYALFTPANDQAQYAICSPIADSRGTVFFKNDSAYLMALTSTVKEIKVTKQPDKMSYSEGETFDPTGMELTVSYTNGESRTLPVSRTINGVKVTYFTYSDTVTADDNGYFELTYVPVMYQSGADGEPVTMTAKTSVPITVTGKSYDPGDINGDGAVDVYDLQYLYEYCCDNSIITDAATLARLDVNGDGQRNITDAAALYDFLTRGSWTESSDSSSAVAQTTATTGGGTARLLSASSAGAIDRAALKGVTASLSSAPAAAATETALRGDINGDGAVDVYDLQYLYEYCCGSSTITDGATLARLDVNGDGLNNISDAAALYSYLTEGEWPSSGHAITVKSTAPKTAQVAQGGMYTLYMSDVFDICSHNVTYTLSGEGLGEHTKLASDDKGWFLSFTNGEANNYPLTITAVCGEDSTVQAAYNLTVTVTKSAAGDDGQYDYDEASAESVTVYVTVSNDGVPIYGIDGTPISHLKVTVPYFDLESQGLEEFYRFHTENGQGGYIDNNVVERPTLLHLYLYLLGVYCKGYTLEEVTSGTKKVIDGQGNRYRVVSDLLDKQRAEWTGPALTITGSATSMYMQNFWGHDENLMYYRNHVYPLMGPGWGATADYVLLSDGDTIDVALFSDWNFWNDGGAFACFDKDEYTVKSGETLTFNTRKYETRSVADGGSESFQSITGMTVYLCDEQWVRLKKIEPTGSGDAFQCVIDQTPGDYYLLAVDSNAGTEAARLAPATARVHVG